MERRFDINPHVIRQLGEELVPDEMTALMELIKNAYDADASFVKIDINTTGIYSGESLTYQSHTGYIVVEDSGVGMDDEAIVKSWLTISYSSKRAGTDGIKKKTKKERTPLGDKGLGRLSTQRLSDCCEIFTVPEGGDTRYHVAFDWREFDKVQRLSEVPVSVESEPAGEKKGTKLVLTNLHSIDVWKGDRLETFKNKIVQILTPFSEVRKFYVYITIDGESIDVMKKMDSILNLCQSSYEFTFDGNILTVSGMLKPEKLGSGNNRQVQDNYKAFIAKDGGSKFADYFFDTKRKDTSYHRPEDKGMIAFTKRFSFQNDMAGLAILDGKKCNPGSFSGKIYDFALTDNFDAVSDVFNTASEYKEYVKTQTGIKIYRDGFAVQPYGFEGDDWLGMRKSQTSGSSFYGLRPENTVGYFAISEGVNVHLKDKTDRQGFIENEYQFNFELMAITYIRKVCDSFIESVRRGYNDFIKKYKQENTGIRSIQQAYSEIRTTADASTGFTRRVSELRKEVHSFEESSNRAIKEANSLFGKGNYEEALKVLEGNKATLARAQSLLAELEEFVGKAAQLSMSVDYIEPKIEAMEQQLDDFSTLAAVGMTAESITHEFPNLIKRLNERNADFKKEFGHEPISRNVCQDFSRQVAITTNTMTQQLRHVSPALRYARESKDTFDLGHFFESQKSQFYDHYLKKYEASLEVKNEIPLSITINEGRFIQVMDNLINNSCYWLRQQGDFAEIPTILISINRPWLYVSDNGKGIAPAVEESLFEPFVTMKPKGQGRGLGLFIVRQLLDAVGCSIVLDERRNSYDRRYIFAINLSNVEAE